MLDSLISKSVLIGNFFGLDGTVDFEMLILNFGPVCTNRSITKLPNQKAFRKMIDSSIKNPREAEYGK
jgi:hypothetical protein